MEMLVFSFELTPTTIALFVGAVSALLLVVFTYLGPAARYTRAVRRAAAVDNEPPEATRAVSVIVFASDDCESLETLLPDILCQRYSAPFEVIVVNDRASDRTAEIVERLRADYPNLYMTYTPDGARSLSLKKLALMLGIKAARYPIVVHTTSAAVIASENWLQRMVAPFNDPAVEVVIGRTALVGEDRAYGRRRRSLMIAADDIAWVGSALGGHPYRGTEMNVAYTRDLFFENRGFSKTLSLKYGDDDLFISEIARPDNTEVVVHPDAMVGRATRDVRRTYGELRNRYAFTGRRLRKTPRRLQAFGAWMMWAVVGLSVAGAVIALPNLFGAAVAAVIVLGMFTAVTLTWRRAVIAAGGRHLFFTLPWLTMTRPLSNVVRAITSRRHSDRNYTWS